MAMPEFTMRQLLEAGVHFGHQTRRWNPKMEPYIYGVRNGIHVIDLRQTVPMLHSALEFVRSVTAQGGRVLFVGTKRQAGDLVKTAAVRCGQYYVNHRWLGGMLTNWKTITASIKRLSELDERLDSAETIEGLTKKERLNLTRERDKLERSLGGIKNMGGLPNVIFVIDTNKEAIAMAEGLKLDIPLIAVVDSNSNPDGIAYPIPGNDDAIRSIALYCDLVAAAVLDGLQQEAIGAGSDIGEADETLPEPALEAPEAAGDGADAEAAVAGDGADAEAAAVGDGSDAEAATPGDGADADDAAPGGEADAEDAAPAEAAGNPGDGAGDAPDSPTADDGAEEAGDDAAEAAGDDGDGAEAAGAEAAGSADGEASGNDGGEAVDGAEADGGEAAGAEK